MKLLFARGATIPTPLLTKYIIFSTKAQKVTSYVNIEARARSRLSRPHHPNKAVHQQTNTRPKITYTSNTIGRSKNGVTQKLTDAEDKSGAKR